MNLWEIAPALLVGGIGAGLYIRLCFRFPPALVLGVVAYSMISKSASVAYLETVEVYLIEVGMVSESVGAAHRQIFYNVFIFAIALSLLYWVIQSKRSEIAARTSEFGTPEYNNELRLALKVSAALLGVAIVNALASPPYALPGTDVNRQQFWADIRFPVLADLVGVLVIFVPAIAGVGLAYSKVTNQDHFRRFSITLMLVYSFYFLLTGARFHGPLMALIFWLGSYWTVLWIFDQRLHAKRMALLVVAAVSAFLYVGYLEVADRGISEMTGSAWDGLMYRIFALQGNIYYGADALTGEGERAPGGLLLGDMTQTVQAYMPANLASAYLDKGVNLAGSMPGNSVHVFGYWFGLVPMAIYAILLGLTVSLYIYLIITGRFLLALPGSYLCLWAGTGYAQGSFSPFLDYKFGLFVVLILIGLLIPRGERRDRPAAQRHTAHAARARS